MLSCFVLQIEADHSSFINCALVSCRPYSTTHHCFSSLLCVCPPPPPPGFFPPGGGAPPPPPPAHSPSVQSLCLSPCFVLCYPASLSTMSILHNCAGSAARCGAEPEDDRGVQAGSQSLCGGPHRQGWSRQHQGPQQVCSDDWPGSTRALGQCHQGMPAKLSQSYSCHLCLSESVSTWLVICVTCVKRHVTLTNTYPKSSMSDHGGVVCASKYSE